MTDDQDKRLAAAADEVAIRALLDRYFHALDALDWDGFRDCFASDAVMILHQGTGRENEMRGSDAITAQIRSRIESYDVTIHSGANVRIDLHGDRARASTHGVANVVIDGHVLVRGLRYVDALERREGRWVIAHRQHNPMWQYEAPSVTPSIVHRERQQEKRAAG